MVPGKGQVLRYFDEESCDLSAHGPLGVLNVVPGWRKWNAKPIVKEQLRELCSQL